MRLRFRTGIKAGEEVVLLPGRSYVLGRDAAVEIVVDEPLVSRRHAAFDVGVGEVVIRDLGSRNGTTVNGQPVTASVRLVGGEDIVIGGSTLAVMLDLPPAVVADAARAPGPATVERAVLRQSVTRANRLAIGAIALTAGVVVIVLGALVSGRVGPAGPNRSEVLQAMRPSTVLVQTDLGSGTGWVLDAEAGLIVTNHHVINGSSSIQVGGEDVESRPATIVGTAPCEDVAVLHVADTTGLRTVDLGSQASLRIGDDVLVLGYPASAGPGDKLVATNGIVSVVQEEWTQDSADVPQYANVVQTNADINPGNSGGPLVTYDGKLVGMNSAGITDINGRTIQGQGYAIGVDRVREVLPELRAGMSWAWTGLGLEYSFKDELERYKLPLRQGMIVATVTPGTPAAEAGLGEDPVLLIAIDGTPVDGTLSAYCELLAGRRAGDDAVFTVLDTNGQSRDVRIAFR